MLNVNELSDELFRGAELEGDRSEWAIGYINKIATSCLPHMTVEIKPIVNPQEEEGKDEFTFKIIASLRQFSDAVAMTQQ